MAYTYKGKPKLIKPYLAKNGETESLSSIKARTGADLIINGGFYKMATGKPESWLVLDGKIVATGNSGYGYAIDGNKIVYSYQNNVNYPQFIGAARGLARDGKVQLIGNDTAKRGRTAIGLTANNELVVYVALDTDTKNRLTTTQLANKMLSLGCVTAIELDGGVSSQYSAGGKLYSSGRAVSWWICIWFDDVPKPRPVLKRGSKGEAVKEMQAVVGTGVDGSFGPLTDTAVRNWQRKYGLVPDGSVGPLTWAKIDEVRK